VILSNIPGLLRDVDDEASLIEHIDADRAEEYMPFAQGRMKKKLLGAIEALDQGVGTVIFGDARVDEPVTRALQGRGTVIQ
jgi:acetylglutamate/LysW-gamma-L-alpha-aminoadipate kinase